jgi:hypothetical protein
MPDDAITWGVFHDLRAGGRRARVLRLTLSGVPAKAKAPAVLELLERAGEGPRFAEGGVPWANHSLLPEGRWPAVLEAGGRAERRRWSDLEGVQRARVVTLRLEPAAWADVTIAAERAGMPMQAWAADVLKRAARAKVTPAKRVAKAPAKAKAKVTPTPAKAKAKVTPTPAKAKAKGPAPKAAAGSSARATGSPRVTPAKGSAKVTPATRAARSGPSSSPA